MTPYERTGIGIVNPYGNLWSDKVYDTPEQAIAALRRFWTGIPAYDESKWGLTMVRAVLTQDEAPGVRTWKVSEYTRTPADYTAHEATGQTNPSQHKDEP